MNAFIHSFIKDRYCLPACTSRATASYSLHTQPKGPLLPACLHTQRYCLPAHQALRLLSGQDGSTALLPATARLHIQGYFLLQPA